MESKKHQKKKSLLIQGGGGVNGGVGSRFGNKRRSGIKKK